MTRQQRRAQERQAKRSAGPKYPESGPCHHSLDEWCRACFRPPGFYATGNRVNRGVAMQALAVASSMLAEAPHG